MTYILRSGKLDLLGKVKQSKTLKAKWTFLGIQNGTLLEKGMSS